MIRATNHAGYTVQTFIPGQGWRDGLTPFTTFQQAADALKNSTQPSPYERRVYEKLTQGENA
jgi:hypothetical protein